MRSSAARLRAEVVRAGLRARYVGRTLHLLEDVDSTNRFAMELAEHGAEHGTVVAAERQTAGKGRLGRSWFSPAGQGLYLSVVLRPDGALSSRLSWIPLVSAMAAAESIGHATGLAAALKWPNDLLLGDRKVGGVLCESVGHAGPPGPGALIVGIGLNVNAPADGFPAELRPTATSLAIEVGHPIDRTQLFTELLGQLEHALDTLGTGSAEQLARAYSGRCLTVGRCVKVTLGPGHRLEGLAEGIEMDGSLRVRPHGAEKSPVIVRAGDVIHVR